MPVYKVEKYLSKCLDSLIKQNFTNWEAILVEDGSPDNCGEICEVYSNRDARFRVIHIQNGGVSKARNAGLAVAKGNWVTFVDSDDHIESNHLQSLFQICKSEKSIAVCGAEYVDENGTTTPWISFSNSSRSRTDDIGDVLLFGGVACKLLNLNIIKNNNIKFNESLKNCEDCLFMWEYMTHIETVGTSLISDIII